MVKAFLTFILFYAGIGVSDFQAQVFPISQSDSMMKSDIRPLVVLISAPWCKWCVRMKHQTLLEVQLKSDIQERFYFLELNAESRESIVFFDRYFTSKAGDYHELALELSENKSLTFPTLVILSKQGEVVFHCTSYLPTDQLVELLQSM